MKGKISFVGSGNVAWHLAKAFDLAGYQIHQVISRNEITGKEFAKKFAAYFSYQIEELLPDADFVFLTIPDHAIEENIKKINTDSPIFIHCAGSCPLSALSGFKSNTAVFYPLQTFTRERPVNFFEIPVFIEASNNFVLNKVTDLAESITNHVKELNSDKRRYLHLAAVMANNFTNHLLAQAEQILHLQNLPFELLKPLVEETVKKAFELSPGKSQTGPAVRNDEITLKRHLEMLKNDASLKDLYFVISEHIKNAVPIG